jgi:hypothetical protein
VQANLRALLTDAGLRARLAAGCRAAAFSTWRECAHRFAAAAYQLRAG